MTVLTPWRSNSFFSVPLFGTESVMRSCDSDIHTCHGESPAFERHGIESTPHLRTRHLATEHESSPAPLSVILNTIPRRASRICRKVFFCVMGSPICTAVAGEPLASASMQMSRRIPSRPTRPPADDVAAGLRLLFIHLLPFTLRGMRPTVPANTSACRGSAGPRKEAERGRDATDYRPH